jgi:hypothetical protein
VKHFPGDDFNPIHRELYNKAVANVMDGVREFLALHYKAAARNDTQYWKDAKTRTMPDGLAERLERWQVELPDSENVFPYYHGLPPYSYMCILLGMGGIPLRPSPALTLSDSSTARRVMREVHAAGEDLVQALPRTYEYFAQTHGK